MSRPFPCFCAECNDWDQPWYMLECGAESNILGLDDAINGTVFNFGVIDPYAYVSSVPGWSTYGYSELPVSYTGTVNFQMFVNDASLIVPGTPRPVVANCSFLVDEVYISLFFIVNNNPRYRDVNIVLRFKMELQAVVFDPPFDHLDVDFDVANASSGVIQGINLTQAIEIGKIPIDFPLTPCTDPKFSGASGDVRFTQITIEEDVNYGTIPSIYFPNLLRYLGTEPNFIPGGPRIQHSSVFTPC